MEHPISIATQCCNNASDWYKKSCDLETANQNTLPKWSTAMLFQN